MTDILSDLIVQRDVLYAFIYALVQDAHLAEDIFQEASLAILEQAQEGLKVERFMPWARRICRNKAVDQLRRVQRQRKRLQQVDRYAGILELAFDENHIDPENIRRREERVRHCIGKLGKRARSLVEGFYGQDCSIADLASMLGWKTASVKVGLSRARSQLGRCLGKANPEP
jgi:RNA polymerase sigma-70 factor (ECF subfamily)